MTPDAFAAERVHLQQISIDSLYAATARRSAANQPHAAAAVDRRDRQTDGHSTVSETLLRAGKARRKVRPAFGVFVDVSGSRSCH